MADEIDARVLARRQKDLEGFVDNYESLVNQRALKFGDSIAPVWRQASQRLDSSTRKLLLQYTNPDGTLSEAKLKTLKNKIDGMQRLRMSIDQNLGMVTAPLTEKMGNGIAYEYAKAYNVTAWGLEQAAQVAINVPTVSAAQVMGVVNNPWLPDGKTYSDRIRQNNQYLADKMRNSITRGVTEGWDVNKTALEIRRTAGEGYFNAVRLARTEYTRAASQGASQLYMENADVLDGKRWNATLDNKTAPRDAKNDGKVYPLEYDTPEMKGKPGERIPNHPHCRCRWTPILSALGISTKDRIARDKEGAREFTPARTYEEYAKKKGLPNLDDRMAAEKPSKYLRNGETVSDFGSTVGKKYVNPVAAPKPTPAAAPQAAPKPTPKPTPKQAEPVTQARRQHRTAEDYFGTPKVKPADEARIIKEQLKAETGKDYGVEELAEMRKSLSQYTGRNYKAIREAQATGTGTPEFIKAGENLDKFIDISPKWQPPPGLVRGMRVPSNSDFLKALEKEGTVLDMRGASSWSSDGSVAWDFAKQAKKSEVKVMIKLENTNNGASVKHLSKHPKEDEILIHSKARFEVTKTVRTGDSLEVHVREIRE